MISLRSYLFRKKPGEADKVCRRVLDLFLKGIAGHAVEGDRADLERFRAEVDGLAKSLTPETPLAELFETSAAAVRAMEDYNLRTGKFVRQQRMELQNMVSMLTQTVITIGASSEASVGKLRDIEKTLDGARMAHHMQALKFKLGECLQTVREEARRQKLENQSSVAALEEKLKKAREWVDSHDVPPELDPATHLASRKEAEKAIQAAVAAGGGKSLLIAVVKRVQAVNARFGYAAGDRMLAAAAEHFRSSLSPADQLFRWHGPSILAILSSADRVDLLRARIHRFADAKLEKGVDLGNRTVLIPVSTNWSLLAAAPPVDALLKKIDAFTAAQISRDYA